MSNIVKASHYQITSLVLQNYDGTKKTDIKQLTNHITLRENMYDGVLSGAIIIFDGVGLYNLFPLRGEEYITLTVRDFEDNEFAHKFFVYGIDDLKPVSDNNDQMVSYKMHFVSEHMVLNQSNIIRRAYKFQHMHEYAEQVYNEFLFQYGQKPFQYDQSDNQLNLVVPAYNPIETIKFFARKAYSNMDMSSTFRFYETKSGFHFRTIEGIMREAKENPERIKEFFYNITHDSTPQGQLNLRKNIISYDMGTVVDTVRDIKSGAYNREIMELDHDNRQVIKTIYNHHDEFNNYFYPEEVNDYHSDNINQIVNKPQVVLVNKNWTTSYDPNTLHKLGPTMTADILTRKHTIFEIYNQHRIKIKIHGDLTLEAGNTVKITLPTFVAKTDERDTLNPHNGIYVIEEITHQFKDTNFYQELTLSRMGIKNDP